MGNNNISKKRRISRIDIVRRVRKDLDKMKDCFLVFDEEGGVEILDNLNDWLERINDDEEND